MINQYISASLLNKNNSNILLFNVFHDALCFRLALEKCDKKILSERFKRFPFGSCGDASLLLAKYLQSKGYGSFKYVLGGIGKVTHAWLCQNRLQIDITCDQFRGQIYKVIVTRESLWHTLLEGKVQKKADIELYDLPTKNQLLKDYHNVLNYL